MLEETAVLDSEHSVDDMSRQQVEGNKIIGLAALGKRRAVRRQHAHDRGAIALTQRDRVRKPDCVVDQRQ